MEPLDIENVDIFYNNGQAYLVAVDEASGYKTCWPIRNSSTKSVCDQLKK